MRAVYRARPGHFTMAGVSPKELRQIVNRLEIEAASRPWLYKFRVIAFVGYAYLFLILSPVG
jgi:hypothetical protein